MNKQSSKKKCIIAEAQIECKDKKRKTEVSKESNKLLKAAQKHPYPPFERMNEDFAIGGERKSDPERLLKCDHVLVQIHPERRRITRHCTNPAPKPSKPDLLSMAESTNSAEKTRTSAPERRGERPIESSPARELQRGHVNSCSGRIRRQEGGKEATVKRCRSPFLRTRFRFMGMCVR